MARSRRSRACSSAHASAEPTGSRTAALRARAAARRTAAPRRLPPSQKPGELIEANALVLVHAAAFPAFRMCFEGAPTIFRSRASISCRTRTSSASTSAPQCASRRARRCSVVRSCSPRRSSARSIPRSAVPVRRARSSSRQRHQAVAPSTSASVTDERLERRARARARRAAAPRRINPIASKARCGADWDAATGNLALQTLTLMAYARAGDTRLPVQLSQLSPALARRRRGTRARSRVRCARRRRAGAVRRGRRAVRSRRCRTRPPSSTTPRPTSRRTRRAGSS